MSKQLINQDALNDLLNREIIATLKPHVEELFKSEPWLQNLQSKIIANFTQKMSKELKTLSLDDLVKGELKNLFDRYAGTIEFNGIDDQATKTELSVMDEVVVIENELVAKKIAAVDSIRTGDLEVLGNLNLSGKIVSNSESWQEFKEDIANKVLTQVRTETKLELLDEVFDRATTNGISFKSVVVDGNKVINGNSLGKSITESSLQSVGKLKTLEVIGRAKLVNGTLTVNNRRIGVNVDEPTMALSLKDGAADISLGANRNNKSFIGTVESKELHIGVKERGDIKIDESGVVTIDQLRIGKQVMSSALEVPGYHGSKGDIVFNLGISSTNPVFAWVCLGGFNWMALKAAI